MWRNPEITRGLLSREPSISNDVVYRCGWHIRESGLFSARFAGWWEGTWPDGKRSFDESDDRDYPNMSSRAAHVYDIFSQDALYVVRPFFNKKTFDAVCFFDFHPIGPESFAMDTNEAMVEEPGDVLFGYTSEKSASKNCFFVKPTVIYINSLRGRGLSSAVFVHAEGDNVNVLPGRVSRKYAPEKHGGTAYERPAQTPLDLSLVTDAQAKKAATYYPWELCLVILHEMMHLSDHHDGETYDMTYADGTEKPWGLREFERRAEEVAHRLTHVLYVNPRHPKHCPNSSCGSSLSLSP